MVAGSDLFGQACEDWSSHFTLPFQTRIHFLTNSATAADHAGLPQLSELLAGSELEHWQGLQQRALPTRQAEWLWGRLLVKHSIRVWYQMYARRVPDWSQLCIIPDEYGKPHLVNMAEPGGPMPVISISHARGVLVTLAADPGYGVGIDIEPLGRIKSDPESFSRMVFNDTEKAKLAQAADWYQQALLYWVLKEAAAKAFGTGLQGKPKQFQVVEMGEGQARVQSGERVAQLRYTRIVDYLCAIAYVVVPFD